MRKLKTIEMHRMTVSDFKQSDKMPLIVMLDDVRSLHNVGSVFRSGDAMSFCNRFRYKSKHFISFIRLFLQNVLLLHQLIQHDTNIIRYVPGAEHCLTLDKQG